MLWAKLIERLEQFSTLKEATRSVKIARFFEIALDFGEGVQQ